MWWGFADLYGERRGEVKGYRGIFLQRNDDIATSTGEAETFEWVSFRSTRKTPDDYFYGLVSDGISLLSGAFGKTRAITSVDLITYLSFFPPRGGWRSGR